PASPPSGSTAGGRVAAAARSPMSSKRSRSTRPAPARRAPTRPASTRPAPARPAPMRGRPTGLPDDAVDRFGILTRWEHDHDQQGQARADAGTDRVRDEVAEGGEPRLREHGSLHALDDAGEGGADQPPPPPALPAQVQGQQET